MNVLSRFVAVGDSFTEGLDDWYDDGTARGWADLVADVLAGTEPDLRYANLAVRSLCIDPIVDRQVPAAVAMRPDLVTIAAGGNDLLGLRADVDHVAARMDEAISTLRATGATTVVFAGFDPRAQLPLGRLLAPRTAAYNARIAESAAGHGALLVDLWTMPELTDARLWSDDRLHLSATGHRHIAGVVLQRLGRPAPVGWPVQLPPATARSWPAARVSEAAWAREHFTPWAVRKLRGQVVGDGRTAKYPALRRWDTSCHWASQPGMAPSTSTRRRYR